MEELTSSATLDMRASKKVVAAPSPPLRAPNFDVDMVVAPRDLVRSGGLEVSTGRRTTGAPRAPRTPAPQAPPAAVTSPALAQLRKWRAKAALYGTLAHHPLASQDYPAWLIGRSAFEPASAARDYYRRCLTMLRVHGSGFPLEDVTETHLELAMYLRIGGDTMAALSVATECLDLDGTNKVAMELTDWALVELTQDASVLKSDASKEAVCIALSRVRVGFDDEYPGGAQRELAIAAMLQRCCGVSTKAGSARLTWIAARASRLQGERKKAYLDQLLEATRSGPLTSYAAEMVATCGDLTLIVKGGDTIMTVQACRMALAESSDYFAKLLSGGFREQSEETVTIETPFARVFCGVVLPFLYRGARLDGPLRDYDVAVQVLALATQFEFKNLKRAAMDALLVGFQTGQVDIDADTASFIWLHTQGAAAFQRAVVAAWASAVCSAIESESDEAVVQLLGSDGLDMALEEGSYTMLVDSILMSPAHTSYTMLATLSRVGQFVSRRTLVAALQLASDHGWTSVIDCAIAKGVLTHPVMAQLGGLSVPHKLLILEAFSAPSGGDEPAKDKEGVSPDDAAMSWTKQGVANDNNCVTSVKLDEIYMAAGDTAPRMIEVSAGSGSGSGTGSSSSSSSSRSSRVSGEGDAFEKLTTAEEKLVAKRQYLETQARKKRELDELLAALDDGPHNDRAVARDVHDLDDLMASLAADKGSSLLEKLGPAPQPPLLLDGFLDNVDNAGDLEAMWGHFVRLQCAAHHFLDAMTMAVKFGDMRVFSRICSSSDEGDWSVPEGLLFVAIEANSLEMVQHVAGLGGVTGTSTVGTVSMAHVLAGRKPGQPQPAPASVPWRRVSTGSIGAQAVCDECRIHAGHLTTCSQFRRNGVAPAPAERKATIGRNRVTQAPSADESITAVLDDAMFPIISFTRTPLVHALLQCAWDEPQTLRMVETLLELGCDARAPCVPGPLECAAWRGFSNVVNVLVRAGATAQVLVPIGWNALHIAVARNHPRIVQQLYGVVPDDYQTDTWMGRANVSMSVVAASRGNAETKALVARLLLPEHRISQMVARPTRTTSTDETMHPRLSQMVAVTTERTLPSVSATALTPPPAAPAASPPLAAAETVVRVLCSGPLLKSVKIGLLRRHTEVRFVTLSLHMLATGTVYMLRESTTDFDSFYERRIAACNVKGHSLVFELDNGEMVTFTLDRYNEGMWVPHVRSIKGSVQARGHRDSMRVSGHLGLQ